MYFQRFTAPDQHQLLEQIDEVRLNLQAAESMEDPLPVLEAALAALDEIEQGSENLHGSKNNA
jgi:hypothetical protein